MAAVAQCRGAERLRPCQPERRVEGHEVKAVGGAEAEMVSAPFAIFTQC